jgi:hypothetical protein
MTPERLIDRCRCSRPRQQPAAFLEQRVDRGVELRRRRLDALPPMHDPLGGELHLLEDALPLRDLRCCPHSLELRREGLRRRVGGERRRAPGAAPRRQVAGQRVEALHRLRLAQEGDQLPRRLRARRALEQHQAGAARCREAGPVGPGQRRRGPVALALLRQAAPELADVPGAADVEGEQAARELVPDVGNGGIRRHRRQALVEDAGVEGERAAERRLRERAPAVVLGEHRPLLQRQREQRVRLVERQQGAEAARTAALAHCPHRRQPRGPALRRLRVPGGPQQVAAIEEQAGVDVPGQAVQAVAAGCGHDVGVEDAGEVVTAIDAGGPHARVERLERVEGDELGQPGVAELAQVGQRSAGVGGQQLLVRRRPRQLLHVDAGAWMPRMEVGQQLGDDLGLAAHDPEVQRPLRIVGTAAAGAGQDGRARGQPLQRQASARALGSCRAHRPPGKAERKRRISP